MTPNELSNRLWCFAARIGKVVDALPDTRLGRHVAGQLVRSGSGDYHQKPRSANNWNHGPIARREQLRVYDPETYELVRTAFNLGASRTGATAADPRH